MSQHSFNLRVKCVPPPLTTFLSRVSPPRMTLSFHWFQSLAALYRRRCIQLTALPCRLSRLSLFLSQSAELTRASAALPRRPPTPFCVGFPFTLLHHARALPAREHHLAAASTKEDLYFFFRFALPRRPPHLPRRSSRPSSLPRGRWFRLPRRPPPCLAGSPSGLLRRSVLLL